MSCEGPVKKGIFKKKLKDVLISCVVATLLILVFVANVIRQERIIASSELIEHAWDLTLLLCTVTCFINFLYQASKPQKILNFLELLGEFDRKVSGTVGVSRY